MTAVMGDDIVTHLTGAGVLDAAGCSRRMCYASHFSE